MASSVSISGAHEIPGTRARAQRAAWRWARRAGATKNGRPKPDLTPLLLVYAGLALGAVGAFAAAFG